MSLVKDAFEDFAKTKSKKFGKARMQTVGASEAGQCLRKIGYLKHDNPKDSNRSDGYVDTWGAARRGNTIEDNYFVPAMRKKFGPKLMFTGKGQKTFHYGLLSATPDGILVDQPKDALASLMVNDIGPSGQIAVECKTIDPRMRLVEPKVEHFIQAQVQMGVMREATAGKLAPDYAVIVYINASFLDDVVEFVVKFDPKVFYAAQVRAGKILNATSASELKPEGWIAGGNECQYCAFAVACKALRAPSPEVLKQTEAEPLDQQTLAQFRDLAEEEKKYAAIASSNDEKRREIQEQIKELMRSKRLRKVKSDNINIDWQTVVGRPSWDQPKLRAAAAEAGLDIKQFERVGEPSDRMIISLTKQDRLATKPKSGKVS